MAQATPQHIESLAAQDSSLFSKRLKIIIAALVMAGALGYFAFMTFQSATVYYYTVSELNSMEATPPGKMVRVSGSLVPSSFQRPEDSTTAYFSLTDGSDTLKATHDGVVPDLFFNEHSEIILEGTQEPNGVFHSQNVIVKCPSKYVGEGGESGWTQVESSDYTGTQG